ncbi:flagellar hook-length control protein FliK [Niveibacterium sp. COAC-50]|uniref:flagellar hook-length control protein FliK n=1 Tax=Niveibacterium sp. COAC-50 TaxID=2729384 RepID=UPI00155798C7|nr:flagellar hook-length control protein FliK [Niveibacterium sp. COAC-50]
MPAMNVSPSPMPAPVSNTAPVQANQPANAAESSTDNGKPANFANALDGAKAKTQKAESDKASDRSDTDATAATDDPARLAQIAAALLASLGAPVTEKPAATLPTQGDAQAAQTGSPDGSLLPLDGKALPAAAVPAAQGSNGETSADTSDKAAAANALLAQTSNRTAATASDEKPNPAVTALGDSAKQPIAAVVAEASGKAAQTKAVIVDTAAQASAPTQPTVSPWADTLANRTAEAARTEAPQFPVRTPVSQSGWADDVGNRMVWMAGKELGRAELILTPPHLGRVEITLNVNGDQTTAHFVTATPAAREAIEQSIPRLRELMTDAGLNLGQVNVSANGTNDPSQEQRSWGGPQRGARQVAVDDTAEVVGLARPAWSQSGRGMVDTFA